MGHNRKDAGIFFPVDFRSVPKARAVTVACQPEIMPRLCFKAGKVYVTSRGDKHKIMTVPHNAAAAFSGQIIDVVKAIEQLKSNQNRQCVKQSENFKDKTKAKDYLKLYQL